MENPIYAPRAGTVKEVRVKPGDKVAEDDLLVLIE
jgi:biotin carboxyl carrier protein